MANEVLTFNELPNAVTTISNKLGELEELIKGSLKPSVSTQKETYYTLPEAAEYCRMAEPTFRTYLNKREVTGCKLGKSWLFTQNDLDTFLNRYRVKSKSEIEQASNNILRRAK